MTSGGNLTGSRLPAGTHVVCAREPGSCAGAWRQRFIPDRPAPVRLPVMFQNWYRMSFLHWPCDPSLLQARLPVGLSIDTFHQTGWVGLTPFHLMGLRPPFLPAISCVSDFPEMNLRTYVQGPSGPGIWFFSLDAAAGAAVLGARLTYGLPYYWSSMSVRATGRNRIEYTSTRAGAIADITVQVGEVLARPDDLVLFLTERYRLYSASLAVSRWRRSSMSGGPCIAPNSSVSRRRYAGPRNCRIATRPRLFTIRRVFTCASVRHGPRELR